MFFGYVICYQTNKQTNNLSFKLQMWNHNRVGVNRAVDQEVDQPQPRTDAPRMWATNSPRLESKFKNYGMQSRAGRFVTQLTWTYP